MKSCTALGLVERGAAEPGVVECGVAERGAAEYGMVSIRAVGCWQRGTVMLSEPSDLRGR